MVLDLRQRHAILVHVDSTHYNGRLMPHALKPVIPDEIFLAFHALILLLFQGFVITESLPDHIPAFA